MFEFDVIFDEKCAEGSKSDIDPVTCKPTDGDPGDDPIPPSVDDRCADPGFYDANPDICAGYPRLILKPAYAIVQVGGNQQYRTYLRTAGDEIEITNGLTYATADPQVAAIESSGGLATGGPNTGITTVSVAWQNLHAYAQIEVVASCSDTHQKFVILIDDSKSAKAGFNGNYATRLDFAKAAATQFAQTANYSKDEVAVFRFDTAGTQVLALSSSQSDVVSAIDSIVQTNSDTDINAGFKAAKDYVSTVTGTKVIIVFSDGENGGDDPLPLAQQFKDAGNIVVVVGLRCWGKYFDLLYKLASPGFFLSAYNETANSVLEILPGLKSFMCSGSCEPVAGTYPMGQYDYRNFLNWHRIYGLVDLIGLGFGVLGDPYSDLQPGHGLYLDLNNIKIDTYDTFDFVAGKTYRLSFKLAGNLRKDQVDGIHVMIGTVGDVAIAAPWDQVGKYLDETITIPWDQEFTDYSYEFTPGTTTSEKIAFLSLNNLSNIDGCLLDDILLENVTDAVEMFFDDFDSENMTTITPGDPYGYYGYQYSCLTTPPGAQLADPRPPTPPLEAGT